MLPKVSLAISRKLPVVFNQLINLRQRKVNIRVKCLRLLRKSSAQFTKIYITIEGATILIMMI